MASLASILLVSVFIEAMQGFLNYILGINYRSIDVDDVLLNVSGGVLGYTAGEFFYLKYGKKQNEWEEK